MKACKALPLMCVAVAAALCSCAPALGPEGPLTVLYDGAAVDPGDPVAFPDTVVGATSAPCTLTVRNGGDVALSVPQAGAVALSGEAAAEYSLDVSGLTASLAPGEEMTFSVTFSPSAAGLRSARLEVALETWEVSVSLVGAGVLPAGFAVYQGADLVPSGGGYSMGEVLVGGEGPGVEFTIQNQGTEEIALAAGGAVTIGGTDAGQFAVVSQPPATVPASGSVTFTLRFAPTIAGDKSATVTIASSTDSSAYTFVISGIGRPQLALYQGREPVENGGSFDFGDLLTGEGEGTPFRTLIFTLYNDGSTDVNLGDSLVTLDPSEGSFVVDTQPSGTVPAGGSVTFSITFVSSMTPGPCSALVSVDNDSGDSPYTFTASGEVLPRPRIALLWQFDSGPFTAASWGGVVNLGTVVPPGGTITCRIYNEGEADLVLEAAPVLVNCSGDANYTVTAQPPTSTVAAPLGEDPSYVEFTLELAVTSADWFNSRSVAIGIHSNDPDYPVFEFSITAYISSWAS